MVMNTVSRGTDISKFKLSYRERNVGDFPDELNIVLKKKNDLKYGENMHQHAAMYAMDSINGHNVSIISRLTNIRYVRTDDKGKGGLSLTNNMDIARAMGCLKYFGDTPSVVILKHNTVAGFAKQVNHDQTLDGLFRLARDADLESNFGGTVVFNKPLDMASAKALYELKGINPFFVDVLAAPGYEEGVLGYIEGQSKNIRPAEFSSLDKLPKFIGDETHGLLSFKMQENGEMGVQDIFLTRIKTVDDFILDPLVYDKKIEPWQPHFIEYYPTPRELDDLVTAWRVNCAGARSNGIVFVKNGVTVAVGSGQVARVYAVKDAIVKGMQKRMDLEGIKYDKLMGIRGYRKLSANPFDKAVCASDAFFPFADSIELFVRVGVSAVCQPFGSERDVEVIDRANKYKIAMPATLERCFGHF